MNVHHPAQKIKAFLELIKEQVPAIHVLQPMESMIISQLSKDTSIVDSESKIIEIFAQCNLIPNCASPSLNAIADALRTLKCTTIVNTKDDDWVAKLVMGDAKELKVSTLRLSAGKKTMGPLDDWDTGIQTLMTAMPEEMQPTVTFERATVEASDFNEDEIMNKFCSADVARVLLIEKLTGESGGFENEKFENLEQHVRLQHLQNISESLGTDQFEDQSGASQASPAGANLVEGDKSPLPSYTEHCVRCNGKLGEHQMQYVTVADFVDHYSDILVQMLRV